MENDNEQQSESSTPETPVSPAPPEAPNNTPVTPPEVANESSAPNPGLSDHKVMAIVGYVLPFLFFVPLITDAKNDKFARFHAGQQLNLLLLWIIGQLVASLTVAILIGLVLYPIVYVLGFALMVIGIINVSKGETKDLPVIGKWHLLG